MCAVLWQHRKNVDQWAVRNTCVFFPYLFLTAESSTGSSDRVCQHYVNISTVYVRPASDLHYIRLNAYFSRFLSIWKTSYCTK